LLVADKYHVSISHEKLEIVLEKINAGWFLEFLKIDL
jgi:hypothetical protein